MEALIDELPIHDRPRIVDLPDGRSIPVKSYQVVLWMRIGWPEEESPPPWPGEEPPVGPFPVVFDTGFNNDFLILEEDFRRWTRRDPSEFGPAPAMPLVDGPSLPRISVALWLYRNVPGETELSDAPPCRLDLNRGLALSNLDKPRLPLFGMTAMESNQFVTHLDSKRRRITIERHS